MKYPHSHCCNENPIEVEYPILMGYLRGYIKQYPNQAEAAKAIGISPQYLCDILLGRRPPAKKVLKALKFEPVTRYVRITWKANH